MARNYILGGMAATQLQAGKPYFKRITRISGAFALARTDGLTCEIITAAGDNQGAINFNNVTSGNWNAAPGGGVTDGAGGELLMVEFPTTMRNVQVLVEEAWDEGVRQTGTGAQIRGKVMLTAEGQDTTFDKTTQSLATPVASGNYIELKPGENATINSRTKVIFILIQKFAGDNVLNPGVGDGIVGGEDGDATDAISLLVTGVLDHEPVSGSASAANEPNSRVIDAGGATRELRKIWGKADGIG